MNNIVDITLPTTLKNFTEKVKQNDAILYNNIANHIENNADRHTASEIAFENGSTNTVQSEINSLLGIVNNINTNITNSNSLIAATKVLVEEVKALAATKNSTTINGKHGDIILQQGAGIVIKEEVETGGVVFTINNTISGGIIVTGNTGRQYTLTYNLASVVSEKSITDLDLAIVEDNTTLMSSIPIKVIDGTNGSTVLQTVAAGVLTKVLAGGILRPGIVAANMSIYIPRITSEV